MRDDIIEACALAMEAAKCPHREGPFGGYDYGHNNDNPVEGGRYVIRDFRDPASENWGKWIHQTDNAAEHDAMLAKMTRQHIARAVLATLKEATAEPTPGMIEATGAKGRVRMTIIFGYRAMHEQLWQEIGI